MMRSVFTGSFGAVQAGLIWLVLTIVVSVATAIPASADGCGCDGIMPVPGVYAWAVDYSVAGGGGITHVEIRVTGSDPDDCGDSFTMSAHGIAVEFVCDNGVYTADMRGTPAEMVAAEGSDRFADSFIGRIGVPEFYSTKGNFTLDLDTAFDTAPDCLCQDVREWIEHAEHMISLYSDQTILDQARAHKQAGLLPGEDAWPNGTDDDEKYLTFELGDDPDLMPSYQRTISEGASVVPTDDESFNSAASTDPLTCEITPPREKSASGYCRPPVVLEAIGLHEEVHSNQCLELTEGVRGAWNYLHWSNHPPNHAADEIRAYTVARDHMKAWVDDSCD